MANGNVRLDVLPHLPACDHAHKAVTDPELFRQLSAGNIFKDIFRAHLLNLFLAEFCCTVVNASLYWNALFCKRVFHIVGVASDEQV